MPRKGLCPPLACLEMNLAAQTKVNRASLSGAADAAPPPPPADIAAKFPPTGEILELPGGGGGMGVGFTKAAPAALLKPHGWR